MHTLYRVLISSSASAAEASDILLRRLEVEARTLDHQLIRSEALIRETRHLLHRLTVTSPAVTIVTAPPLAALSQAWRLYGHGPWPVDCTIERIGRAAFRVQVARDGTAVITDQYSDAEAAAARAQRLERDLLALGWSAEPVATA